MTVISVTNCPPKLRGDLTLWLIEINTGVYVGNISARVRDELWERITKNIKCGQATMVFQAAGEQHMDFRVHNTTWAPVDCDGLKLMRRPSPATMESRTDVRLEEGFSKAARMRKTRMMQRVGHSTTLAHDYTVLDLETTGVQPETDSIIELSALRVRGGEVAEEFTRLVRTQEFIPCAIQELTGITDSMLSEKGKPLKEVLTDFSAFLGSDRLLCWNTGFDIAFLQIACSRCGLPVISNKADDAMKLARKKQKGLSSYQLSKVAEHFGIECGTAHRALNDCYLTHAVFCKLNET